MNWEVRAMKSSTPRSKESAPAGTRETLSSEYRGMLKGFFNPTLMKKNLTRFWPLWGVYTAILFFALPMELIQFGTSYRSFNYTAGELQTVADNYLYNLSNTAVPLGLVFGLLAAMALFSYLMNARSCQLLHSLPIRREGLFFTNWLSGLWFFAVPNAVIALLSSVLGAVFGIPVFPGVWLWWLIATSIGMFFFCFAACCAMFTGHILALPVFYGILNVLVTAVCFLLDMTMRLLLVGFSGTELSSTDFARWCTPVYQLFHLLSQNYDNELPYGLYNNLSDPVGAICYCIVLGAVFTFIAVAVYRFRQLERSGDLVTVGWVRPVFQYGFAVCAGLSLGWIIHNNFFEGPWSFIILVVLCAVVGAFAARMMLKKTFRVFREGWKGVAVFAVVLAFLLGGARADLFGYQRWVPDPQRVAYVELSGIHSSPQDTGGYLTATLTDPGDIAAVTDLHAALVSDLKALEEGSAGRRRMDQDGNYQLGDEKYLRLDYHMADGTIASRNYSNIWVTADDLSDPATVTAKLQALLDRPTVIAANYLSFLGEQSIDELTAVGGSLDNVKPRPAEAAADSTQEDTKTIPATSTRNAWITLDAKEAEVLWAAVKADLAAGNIGRRYVLDNAERYRNCYQTDLTLSFILPTTGDSGKNFNTFDATFTLQTSAAETLKALEDLGYGDDLIPWNK